MSKISTPVFQALILMTVAPISCASDDFVPANESALIQSGGIEIPASPAFLLALNNGPARHMYEALNLPEEKTDWGARKEFRGYVAIQCGKYPPQGGAPRPCTIHRLIDPATRTLGDILLSAQINQAAAIYDALELPEIDQGGMKYKELATFTAVNCQYSAAQTKTPVYACTILDPNFTSLKPGSDNISKDSESEDDSD